MVLLVTLMALSACLAGAETAITTLWPWKVKKIAEEEGEGSPFKLLEKDITKFLTAILIGTTTCTIYYVFYCSTSRYFVFVFVHHRLDIV